jgi:predicted ABC-type ATPase
MRNIIILYGLPGSGKSTISELLIRDFNFDLINIDDTYLKIFLKPTYSVEESITVFNEFLLQIQAQLSKNIGTLIIEGVFASITRLYSIQEIAERYNYSLRSIFLFNSIENLITITSKRNLNGGHLISKDNLIFLSEKFNSREFCDISINTSKVSINQTINIIKNIILDGK